MQIMLPAHGIIGNTGAQQGTACHEGAQHDPDGFLVRRHSPLGVKKEYRSHPRIALYSRN